MSGKSRKPPVWSPLSSIFGDKRSTDYAELKKLYRHVQAAHNASNWAKPETFQAGVDVIYDQLNPQPPEALCEDFLRVIIQLLRLETLIFDFPEIDFSAPMSLKEQVELRAFLRAKERFLARDSEMINLLSSAIVNSLDAVTAALPALQTSATTLAAPVAAFVRDLPKVMNTIVANSIDEKLSDLGLCRDLYYNCGRNIHEASGIQPGTESKKQLIFPHQSKLPPDELVNTYLAGTPFRELFSTSAPFAIPRHAYRAHGCIFAPSDHGKTQTLQAIIVGFLNEPDPPALFIMDSMGSMLRKLERLELFQGHLQDRLVILDPTGPNPPRLNFFRLSGGTPAQQTELLFYLFKALDQSFTTRQKTAVVFLAQLLQRLAGTLDDLRKICEEKQPQHLAIINALPPVARDFFLNSFYKPDPLMTQTKQQIAARLYTLAATPLFDMFSANNNSFNAFDCIQQKKIVLVNTDRLALGEEGATIFGRFVIAQVLAAAFARAPIPEGNRHLALLIVDEAKAYLDEQTEKFLSDARQFWVGLLLATQYVHQLEEGVRRAVYGNTAIKLIGPIEYSDRVSLAREMHTTPEFIGSMRSYDRSHTEWAAYVRTSNMTPQAVRLRVPYGVLEAMPQLNAVEIGPHASQLSPQTHEAEAQTEAQSSRDEEEAPPSPPTKAQRVARPGPPQQAQQPPPYLDDANGRVDKGLRLLTPPLSDSAQGRPTEDRCPDIPDTV